MYKRQGVEYKAFEMYFMQGMDYAEIAEQLDTGKNTPRRWVTAVSYTHLGSMGDRGRHNNSGYYRTAGAYVPFSKKMLIVDNYYFEAEKGQTWE